MKTSITSNTAISLLAGLSTVVSASTPLATISPCPSCPSSVMPAPVTVTAQYQTVSTCVPSTSGTKTVPSCSSYDFVSTVIPCLGGSSSTTVTKTDQIVTLAHISTVITSLVPCPTVAPKWGQNGTASASACTSTQLTTMISDASCPYNQIGPLGIPGYAGSGLCSACAEDANGSKHQPANIVKCLDGKCSTYVETWVSTKPASTAPSSPSTSTSAAQFSSSTYCPSQGVYTIPVTTVCTPSAPGFTAPVTSTFDITTSVSGPQTVGITKIITFTFVGTPQAVGGSTSASTAQITTSASCPTNGQYTIPITKTFTPTGPGFTAPVTTTCLYTTSVTNAPTNIGCTTVITVIFTQTSVYPVQTVVSGTTLTPTAPASASASTSTNGPSSTLSQSSTPSTTAKPTPTPGGKCDYVGCYGSAEGFPEFDLAESTGSMTIELCESECIASGKPYSGLYMGDCYCAPSIDHCQESGDTCNLPCPGNKAEKCGGDSVTAKLRGRSFGSDKLYDVYSCPVPTSTTTTSDSTSTTSSASTPDPSSDEDPDTVKRGLDADLEIAGAKKRQESKLRRGGMLRSMNKVEKANVLAKRDFGLKKPFGL